MHCFTSNRCMTDLAVNKQMLNVGVGVMVASGDQ